MDAAVIYGIPMAEDQIKFYLDILGQSGVSDERLAAGVKAACKVCKFMPKPADILEHIPSVKTEPAADDFEMSQDDRDFGKAAAPIFARYVRKEITKDQLVAGLRAAARDLGIEGRMDWNAYYQGDIA